MNSLNKLENTDRGALLVALNKVGALPASHYVKMASIIEGLDLKNLDMRVLATFVDLIPGVSRSEVLVMKLVQPSSFLLYRQGQSSLSSFIEYDNITHWGYEDTDPLDGVQILNGKEVYAFEHKTIS